MATDPKGVTAVVAAFNEADRIGRVLDVLTSYPGFAEVIVVDDGSTDETAAVAAQHGVRVERVTPNQGKGHAMDIGVQAAATDVIFFADADIIGLTHEMISETIRPVKEGKCEMFILMRNRKIYLLHRLMAFIPLLGGERALTKHLWTILPGRYKDRFRIEAGLNFYAIHYGAGLRYRVFTGISQTVKEAKFGFWDGFRRRLGMFREVLVAAWDLQWNDLPRTAKARRALAGMLGLTAAGMLLGLLLIAAGMAGPVDFFQRLFSEELTEDPAAPFARLVLATVSAGGAGAILGAGSILLTGNALFFVRSLLKIVTVGRIRDAA